MLPCLANLSLQNIGTHVSKKNGTHEEERTNADTENESIVKGTVVDRNPGEEEYFKEYAIKYQDKYYYFDNMLYKDQTRSPLQEQCIRIVLNNGGSSTFIKGAPNSPNGINYIITDEDYKPYFHNGQEVWFIPRRMDEVEALYLEQIGVFLEPETKILPPQWRFKDYEGYATEIYTHPSTKKRMHEEECTKADTENESIAKRKQCLSDEGRTYFKGTVVDRNPDKDMYLKEYAIKYQDKHYYFDNMLYKDQTRSPMQEQCIRIVLNNGGSSTFIKGGPNSPNGINYMITDEDYRPYFHNGQEVWFIPRRMDEVEALYLEQIGVFLEPETRILPPRPLQDYEGYATEIFA